MKLYAEQIQYLRKRREELEGRKSQYKEYCETRESGGMEGIGAPHYLDFQSELDNSNTRRELAEIENKLQKATFAVDRNFDMIDIGTAFYTDFGDGELERTMLIEAGTTLGGAKMYASTESPFGQAVLGKKAGDVVTYQVQGGRKITVSIKEIDQVRENYLHFIKEKKYSDRVCDPVAKELRRLKVEDEKEYQERQALTASQIALLHEELYHVGQKDAQRKAAIKKLLATSKVAPLPTGSNIQIGSIVDIMLQDGDKEPTMHHFEMINKAVSTEIDADYVERISTLGNAIYGLKAGDTFLVRRKNQPSIKGIVSHVENSLVNERVR